MVATTVKRLFFARIDISDVPCNQLEFQAQPFFLEYRGGRVFAVYEILVEQLVML
jgi:hypothetical protein